MYHLQDATSDMHRCYVRCVVSLLQVCSVSVVQPDELRQLLKLQGPVEFKKLK
jgi:hypothetical protein